MNGFSEEFGGRDAVLLALTRHQQRREQDIPTLSVLVGSREAAIIMWQNWVVSMGWPLSAMAFWPQTHYQASGDIPSIGSQRATVLYVSPPSTESSPERVQPLSAAVEQLSRRLVAQVAAMPGSTVLALAVEAADAESYLRDAPYSRARAIFAEGIVPLPEQITGDAPPPDHDSSRTKALGETASQPPAAQIAAEDRARSAAERFLFELLDQLPETAGLFELNARLGFCFGPMPAEVDLLAASLRLAVELDGFHHFNDPERYRRDRRKDALLQKQGYLVLRFLAEDVVVRMEDILSEVRAAVAFRRATR
jgi:hypothetical protein